MSTQVRFFFAIGLMLIVLVGTNYLFPPIPPEPPPPAGAPGDVTGPDTPTQPGLPGLPGISPPPPAADDPEPPTSDEPPEAAPTAPPPPRAVVVDGPLYRYEFSTQGALLHSVELPGFVSLREDGPVQLVPGGASALGYRVVAGADTLDLSTLPFEVTPSTGLFLREGGSPDTLTFRYSHPAGAFTFEAAYVFRPNSYVVEVAGRVRGAERPLVLTHLGRGLAFNEADSASEARMMAYVGNHMTEGIRSQAMDKVDRVRLEDGPFLWAAFRSKFFVAAILPGAGVAVEEYLGGLLVSPGPVAGRASVSVAQTPRADGSFHYRLLMGPQDYAMLVGLGSDLQEVNPYGWRFFRPIVRPFVSIITTVLTFLHNTLGWGYGWVLILFGIIMRIVLWPFNQKAMKAQMRNMAVQPMVKEIQTKYKDNPERMQKEMLRLYKEYGFNPMAGCLPMLLPWPILIALFFVFQNTIEFRGVPFLWFPDLSAPDPLYILPIILALSMFLLQYISYKAMDQDNPQMKMMMYFFPVFFGFLFMQFAAGLNLYYAVSNIATLPQQYWIAQERKKVQAAGPLKLAEKG